MQEARYYNLAQGRPGTLADVDLAPAYGDEVGIYYASNARVSPLAGTGHYVGQSAARPELAEVLVLSGTFESDGVTYGANRERKFVVHPSYLMPLKGPHSASAHAAAPRPVPRPAKPAPAPVPPLATATATESSQFAKLVHAAQQRGLVEVRARQQMGAQPRTGLSRCT